MTETSRFDTNTAYSAADFAEMFASAYIDGVEAGILEELNPKCDPNNQRIVLVQPGIAWIRGSWYKNDAPKPIEIPEITREEVATALKIGDVKQITVKSAERIDRIVLRSTWREQLGGWKAEAVLLIGSLTPINRGLPPDLTRTNEQIWEIPIARIKSIFGDPTLYVIDEREHLVSAGLTYTFGAGASAVDASASGYLVVPFSCKPRTWSIIADKPASVAAIVEYTTMDDFANQNATWSSLGDVQIGLSGERANRGVFDTAKTPTVPANSVIHFSYRTKSRELNYPTRTSKTMITPADVRGYDTPSFISITIGVTRASIHTGLV
ncbi:MAG: hypothetical protein METHP_01486 [Methanoregula sp. SKADARSKE-2]|nr:MAG: hypothetical protein METHP_01486 [Methanoregula sp. SKADARSKE-2]